MRTVEELSAILSEENYKRLQDIIKRALREKLPRVLARRETRKGASFVDKETVDLESFVRDFLDNSNIRTLYVDTGNSSNLCSATSTNTPIIPSGAPPNAPAAPKMRAAEGLADALSGVLSEQRFHELHCIIQHAVMEQLPKDIANAEQEGSRFKNIETHEIHK